MREKIEELLKTEQPVLCFVSDRSEAEAQSIFGKIAVITGVDESGLYCNEDGSLHQFAYVADLTAFANGITAKDPAIEEALDLLEDVQDILFEASKR